MGNQRKEHSLQTSNHLMVDLNDGITMIILSNLSVKSLLRFKCVSKLWDSWISSPKFEFSNQRRGGAITLLASSFRLINQQLTLEELNNPSMELEDETCMILGSCNGLILVNINKHIYLWNPATRFCRKVLEFDYLNSDVYFTCGGLCFDSSKNVYKVVLIMHRYTHSNGFVVVASLDDENNKWMKLEFPYDILSVCDGITLHGQIHYRGRGKKSEDNYKEETTNKLIYFDPITEKFHMLPVPEVKSDQVENVIVGLGALNECLCLTRLEDNKGGIEILIMKKHGVKESWTSLFFIRNLEINPYFGTVMPLFMTENGELILMIIDNYEKNVLVYDPKKDNMQNILIDSGKEEEDIWFAINYEESLISPEEYYWNSKQHEKLGRIA